MRRLFRTRAARADEAGFTFLEVLITLSFLSFAFVAIIGALGTMIVASDRHARITTAEGAVRSAAEFVKSPTDTEYVACSVGPLAAYQADLAAFALPTPYTASVVSVAPSNGDSPATFATDGTCPASDAGLQLVTVRVDVGGSGISQTVEIVKREP